MNAYKEKLWVLFKLLLSFGIVIGLFSLFMLVMSDQQIFVNRWIFLISSIVIPTIFVVLRKFLKREKIRLLKLQLVSFYHYWAILFSVSAAYISNVFLVAIFVTLTLAVLFFFFKREFYIKVSLACILGHVLLHIILVSGSGSSEMSYASVSSWMQAKSLTVKEVKDVPGLRKIFYVMDYFSPETKTFSLGDNFSGRYRVYDPYKIIFFGGNKILVTHEKVKRNLVYNLDTLDIETLWAGTTNYGFFDKETMNFYLGDSFVPYEKSFYVEANVTSGASPKEYKLNTTGRSKNWFLFKESDGFKGGGCSDTKIYIYTVDGRFVEIDKQSHKIQRMLTIPKLPFFLDFGHLAFDFEKNTAYITLWYVVFAVDLETFKIKAKRYLPVIKLKYCPLKQKLLGLDPILGYVYFLNREDLTIDDKVKIDIRDKAFHFDPELNYIFTGGYFDGMFSVYKREKTSWKKIKSFYLGACIRSITYVDELKKVYIGSDLGIFEYRLDSLESTKSE